MSSSPAEKSDKSPMANKRQAKAKDKLNERVVRATLPNNDQSSPVLPNQQRSETSAAIFSVQTVQPVNSLRSRNSVHLSNASSIQHINSGVVDNTFLMNRKLAFNQQVQTGKTPTDMQPFAAGREMPNDQRQHVDPPHNHNHGQKMGSYTSNHIKDGAQRADGRQSDSQQQNNLIAEADGLASFLQPPGGANHKPPESGNPTNGEGDEESKQQVQAQLISLYVQLPNETMSELVREYPAHFYDINRLCKAKRDQDQDQRPEEELNLTLNPTSLLEKNMRQKQAMMNDRRENNSILSSNRSGTADFLNHPQNAKTGGVYGGGQGLGATSQKSAGSFANRHGNPSPYLPQSKQPILHKPDLFFKLGDVLVYLKKQGYPIEGANVSFYSAVFSAFVNCSVDPVGDFVHIFEKDLECIDNSLSLRLRFEKGVQPIYKEEDAESSEKEDDGLDVMSHPESQRSQHTHTLNEGSKTRNNNNVRTTTFMNNNECSRSEVAQNASGAGNYHFEKPKTKERTVAYVIEKVTQWRRLYNGYYDKDFNHQRLSLEDSADQVGVSKKSLDDYLSQLRSGRQCGYNFNQFKNEKVGHLRKFVKDHLDQLANQAANNAEQKSSQQ